MADYLKEGKKELLFAGDKSGFGICHASNICALRGGSLMAVWFAGSREGSDDVAIWGARNENGQWTGPEKLAHDIQEPHWNPVLYQDTDGELLLFYKTGREISGWCTKIRRSGDGGKSFGPAEELVEGDRGGRGPVRCKVIRLSDGSMLAGTSREAGIWTAYADRSEDKGNTWSLSNPVMIDVEYHGEHTAEDSAIEVSEQSFFGRGVIQPTLWESEAGQVHMLLRSSEGGIYRADSMDYGRSWGKAYDTGLPNNNSGIDVVKCRDGLLVLCMNPVGENWGPRTPLVLMTSADNGNTWNQEAVLEDEEGEYSYPSIIARDAQIYVTYTYDRKSIAFWQFNRKEIERV